MPFGRVQPLLAALAALTFWAPGRCTASTAIVPDGYPTIQLGIDSGADTILVRAGTYAENVVLVALDRPIVLMADPAASPRPTLQGLIVRANHSYEGNRKVVGLRVLTPVDIQSGSVSARFDFEACLFEAGLGSGYEPGADHNGRATTLRRCLIRGNTLLGVGSLTMESDTLEAGGARFKPDGPVDVRNCWFRGPGIPAEPTNPAGLSVRGWSPVTVVLAGNVFEGCAVGVGLFEVGSIRIENNLFRDCGQGIVSAEWSTAEILGNELRRCGVGITASAYGSMRVVGNTVTDGGSHGMELYNDGWDLEVRNNTVLRCAGTGIRVTESSGVTDARRITGNTSALNGGSGFYVRLYDANTPSIAYVSNNIAHGNGVWGFVWDGAGAPTLSCNDWFGNTAGATSGVAPGATDLAVDPLFCDLANDDVRLRSDSPLLGGACGTIGAQGMGCDASTEVLVALFAAEASDEGVRIRWRLGGDEEPLIVWIERSAVEVGPWLRVATERSMDGVVATDWDRTAEAGRRYWYRIAWTTADGRTTYSSPIVIDLDSPASSLALRVIGPNPASGPVVIEYVLPRSTAIDLTVHDLMGREVTRLASGVHSKGLHVTQWAGTIRGGRASPGIYFVRLSSAEGRQSRRILVRQ